MQRVLTIAGSDPSGGAGAQGDLKTFAAYDVYGTAVLTALTAQNTCGVAENEGVSARMVERQLEVLFDDFDIAAAKTGMLGTPAVVATVAEFVERQLASGRLGAFVVDPVLSATSGDALASEGVAGEMIERLLPLAGLVTPNLPEAERLVGFEITSPSEMRQAGEALVERGARAVLVKGGHLPGARVVDLFFDGSDWYTFDEPRIDVGGEIHGTGCALAAAVTAELAKGVDLVAAVSSARAYVRRGIERSLDLGRGARVFQHAR